MKLKLRKDLKEIIATVTNKNNILIFNDKRKKFRKFKFVGVRNLSDKQLNEIKTSVNEKYPQFKAEYIPSNFTPNSPNFTRRGFAYAGLVIRFSKENKIPEELI